MMMRALGSLLLAAALAGAGLPGLAAQQAPVAAPSPVPTQVPTPTAPLYVTGQLLDIRDGFVYFTTGNAFKIISPVHVVDFETGEPTTIAPTTGLYARAMFDAKTKQVVELAITKRRLANSSVEQVRAFLAAGSTPEPAPELHGGQRLTGKPVPVTFYIEVPSTTSLTDNVYIATDASGWNAQAYKMDRVDATHYRLTRTFASGTKFYYRITRGSWNSVERDRDGLEHDPHLLFVNEVDALRKDVTVYSWSDQTPGQPVVGPDSIPTPFNPNPFGNLPGKNPRTGQPQPAVTPPR
jgi:hypothetical protein